MESPEEHANEKRIALWPGRHREDGDKHPYLTGRLTLDGKTYFVTLWKRERQSARMPVLSGEITLADDEQLDI